MTPFLNSLSNTSKLTSASDTYQTQSSTDLSFNCRFPFYLSHQSNPSPDLSSRLLPSICHHHMAIPQTPPAQGAETAFTILPPTPAPPPVFLISGERTPPFPKRETQRLPLSLLSPSPALSPQVLLIPLHWFVSSPSPSLLFWLPNSGFSLSFHITATAEVEKRPE